MSDDRPSDAANQPQNPPIFRLILVQTVNFRPKLQTRPERAGQNRKNNRRKPAVKIRRLIAQQGKSKILWGSRTSALLRPPVAPSKLGENSPVGLCVNALLRNQDHGGQCAVPAALNLLPDVSERLAEVHTRGFRVAPTVVSARIESLT